MSAQISTVMASRNHSSMDDAVLRSSYEQKGTFKTAQNIIANRGPLGMYSGFRLHLMRDTLGTIIYFSTYECTKQMFVKLQGSHSPNSPLSVALAGGFCGLMSWACVGHSRWRSVLNELDISYRHGQNQLPTQLLVDTPWPDASCQSNPILQPDHLLRHWCLHGTILSHQHDFLFVF